MRELFPAAKIVVVVVVVAVVVVSVVVSVVVDGAEWWRLVAAVPSTAHFE